jgi:hypothetical protein
VRITVMNCWFELQTKVHPCLMVKPWRVTCTDKPAGNDPQQDLSRHERWRMKHLWKLWGNSLNRATKSDPEAIARRASLFARSPQDAPEPPANERDSSSDNSQQDGAYSVRCRALIPSER